MASLTCEKARKRLKSIEMEDNLFVIDTNPADDNENLQTFNSPFPIFNRSKLVLGNDDEDNTEEEAEESEDDDYFGKLNVIKLV